MSAEMRQVIPLCLNHVGVCLHQTALCLGQFAVMLRVDADHRGLRRCHDGTERDDGKRGENESTFLQDRFPFQRTFPG